MEQFIEKIDEKLRDSLQARSIELAGLERLIGFALANTEYAIPDEKLENLMKKHAEVNGEYELLKQQVSNYLMPKYGRNIDWNLDFESAEATITKK